MHKTLASRQVFALLFLLLISSALTIGKGLDRSGWLSLCFALLWTLPVYGLLLKVNATGSQTDWFERITDQYGRRIGGTFLWVFGGLALIQAVFSLRSFLILTRSLALAQTNSFLLGGFLMALVIVFASGGILQAGRWAAPVFWLVLSFLVASILMTIPDWDPENLYPLVAEGWQTPLKNSVALALSIGVDGLFLLAMTDNRRSPYSRPVHRALGLSYLLLICVFLRNLFLLGYALSSQLVNPSYAAAGLISLGSFFQRGEVLVTIPFVLCDLIRLCILVMFAKDCVLAGLPRLSAKQVAACLGIPVFAAGCVLSEQNWDPEPIRFRFQLVTLFLFLLFSLLFLLWHGMTLPKSPPHREKTTKKDG